MIVDRIKQRAISWSTKFLSSEGKLVMLKLVLSAMPTYIMSCFKLPISLCKRIQSTLTRFWWDGNSGNKKICWIAWDKLTKKVGGLGFRDIQCFNDALLAKLSQRIMQYPEGLLAKTLLGKYCISNSFLDSQPPSTASDGWKDIMIGKELLKQKLGKVIGNGGNTKAWKEPWLSVNTSAQPMGPPNKDTQNMLVSELLDHKSGKWDSQKITLLFP